MRSSRLERLALVLPVLLALLAVVVPLWCTAMAVLAPESTGSLPTRPAPAVQGPIPSTFLGTWGLMASSLAWSILPAVAATLLAWPLATGLARRLLAGRGHWMLAIVAVPAFVPGYLVFWSLWSVVGPGSALGDAIMRGGAALLAREAALIVGLVTWTIPFAAAPVLVQRLVTSDPSARLRALDGATRWARLTATWRRDRGALVRGVACAAIAILAENVAFDLAQIRTYGYELRTLDATGATPATMARLAWPGVGAVLVLLGLVAWFRGSERSTSGSDDALAAGTRCCRPWGVGLGMAVVVAPLASVLARSLALSSPREFLILYGHAALASAALAVTVGGLVGLAAAGLAVAWRSRGTGVRVVARLTAIAFVVACAAPATLIAIGLESAYNRAWSAWIYDGPAIVLLGLVARCGVAAAVAAPLAAASEPRRTRELVALDGPGVVTSLFRARRVVVVAAFSVAAVAATAYALGEIAVTARVRPPLVDVLATAVLNAIHYQQPETVLLATSACVVMALAASVTLVWCLSPRRRRGSPVTLAVLLVAAGLPSCGPTSEPSSGAGPSSTGIAPIPVRFAKGSPGFGPGQFHTPRVVAVDRSSGRFFVIDKESRVQRFSPEGTYELEWSLPEHAMGCPVGGAVHPDGRVFISDTHYQRVLVYDQEGHELARFGSFGTGPGQFIYVTDVAFGPDGRIYVGEYGNNDRVQIFDRDFRPIGAFGSMGSGEGQFGRPQSLAFDHDRNELYVADSNNHRIVVCDPEGRVLRMFGSVGSAPGQLAYPRGITLVGDGTILVGEFGNHRVQHLDARPGPSLGASLGIWGGVGTGEGHLQYPWDLDGPPEHLIVLDTGRNRFVMTSLDLSAPEAPADSK